LTKSKNNIIAEYQDNIEGISVTVHKIKTKDKKAVSYGRPSTINCPYCLSKLITDKSGLQQCSGDRLEFWDKEFYSFFKMNDYQKKNYIKNITEESQFFELYDKWVYTQNPESNEKFSCGYTNKIFFPIPSANVTVPDPIRMSYIEKKLGRPLTEEEIYGESELWQFGGSILKEYRKGCRRIKIPLIRFPEDF
jgi:hypothetical protein